MFFKNKQKKKVHPCVCLPETEIKRLLWVKTVHPDQKRKRPASNVGKTFPILGLKHQRCLSENQHQPAANGAVRWDLYGQTNIDLSSALAYLVSVCC